MTQLGESGGFRVFQTKPIQSEITNTLSGVPHVIDDRISLTRAGNELILCHYDSGVRVSGLVHPLGSLEYYIDFRVHVPYSYKNQSGALLGNFDGNTNVELFTRSGTKITNLESMNLYRNMLSCKFELQSCIFRHKFRVYKLGTTSIIIII